MSERINSNIDELIVRNFVNGDISAFDELYFLFCSRLQNFVFGLVKVESESEELVQDIFVKIWESRGNIQKHGSFESFLFTVAYNRTISHLRKKEAKGKYINYIKSIQTEGEEPKLDEKIDFEKFKQRLENVIELMPRKQKEVFKLKHFENYSYRQISEELNISVKTVENHLLNSRRFVKRKLTTDYLAILLFISLFL